MSNYMSNIKIGDINFTIKDKEARNFMNNLQTQVNNLASGSPLVASSIEGMTDTTKVYVNTTDGNWYYHNGSAWTSGGVYQATEIGESKISLYEIEEELKESLSKEKYLYTYEAKDSTHYRIVDGVAVENTEVTGYQTKIINVKTNELYKIQVYTKSANAYGYIFTDDNLKVVSYGLKGDGNQTAHDITVKVPTGATKLIVTNHPATGTDYLKVIKMEIKNCDNESKKTNKALNFRDVNFEIKSPSHYRIDNNNVAFENTEVTSYNSTIIDVNAEEIYKIALTIHSDRARGYIFTDNELNVIDYGMGGNANMIDTFFEEVVIVPAGATKMIVSYRNNYPVTIQKAISKIKSNISGKTISVIGDSISTKVNRNAYEIVITESDIGIELSAYLTSLDVEAGLTLGGHTFTSDEIGTEVTFTPISEDIGKGIGLAKNYNSSGVKTWWENLEENDECVVNPVCWSGSSITSHEETTTEYKTSSSWHEAQIRKVGIRVPGTMQRVAPDYIIIYRGTNDFSHSPYTRLSENTFDNYNFEIPETDIINDNQYGYKEGLAILISKLRTAYPSSKIYLCTLNVFKRVNYSKFPTNNGINSLPQYNNAIREVADFMGCGVIELDKNGITFENCYSEGYITDSETTPTHPNSKGHLMIYNQVIKDI